LLEVGVRYPDSGRDVIKRTLIAWLRLKFRGLRFREVSSTQAAESAHLLRRIDVLRSAVDGLASNDPMRAASVMLEGVRLALDVGEPSRVAWALAHYALLAGSRGSAKQVSISHRLLDDAKALAQRSRVTETTAVVKLTRAKLSLSLGAWRAALNESDDCSRYVREACQDGWGYMTVANNISLFSLQTLGYMGELKERAGKYIRVAADVGDLYA
jgi:hypothetical protein